LTRLRDHPVAELAALLHCPAQTLRQRRRRAEMRIVASLCACIRDPTMPTVCLCG
jgi:hypothetical protein